MDLVVSRSKCFYVEREKAPRLLAGAIGVYLDLGLSHRRLVREGHEDHGEDAEVLNFMTRDSQLRLRGRLQSAAEAADFPAGNPANHQAVWAAR